MEQLGLFDDDLFGQPAPQPATPAPRLPANVPGECRHETATVKFGGSIKSECGLLGKWTNCRERGRCLAT